MAARDPVARSRARLPAHRLPRHLLRVPLRHDARARARVLQDVRVADDRRAAAVDRRVHGARSEALRRHRPADQRVCGGRLGRRGRQARAPPHEPDPRPVRDRERRPPLCPVGDGGRADPVERALRLAAPPRGRAAGGVRLLARDRDEDGDSRHPDDARPAHCPERRVRARSLRPHRGGTVARARTARRLPRVVPVAAETARRAAVSALLGEREVALLGLDRPTRLERRAAVAALRLRGRAVRVLPARRTPRLRTTMRRRSYPAGYAIEKLGPPP